MFLGLGVYGFGFLVQGIWLRGFKDFRFRPSGFKVSGVLGSGV